jgi:hypothetical protein
VGDDPFKLACSFEEAATPAEIDATWPTAEPPAELTAVWSVSWQSHLFQDVEYGQ